MAPSFALIAIGKGSGGYRILERALMVESLETSHACSGDPMKNAIQSLFGSKKAVVFMTTVIIMAAVTFGIDPEHAAEFVDKLTALAMAYLGGQGLADLGKYAGEAYSSGKRAVAERERNPESPSVTPDPDVTE
jgi:hypothetical protein